MGRRNEGGWRKSLLYARKSRMKRHLDVDGEGGGGMLRVCAEDEAVTGKLREQDVGGGIGSRRHGWVQGKEVGEAQGVPNIRRDDRVSAVADSKPQALRSRRGLQDGRRRVRVRGAEGKAGDLRGQREKGGVGEEPLRPNFLQGLLQDTQAPKPLPRTVEE